MKVLRESWLVYRRYLRRNIKDPLYMGVSLVQPLLYLVLFAPILKSVAALPGFPRGGPYNVFVPGLLVQLSLFSVTSGGWGLIAELRAGILERLRVTPVSRIALLMGRSLRDVTLLVVQAALIVAVAVPFGLQLEFPGVLLALLLIGLLALLMGSVSYAVALVIRDENRFGALVFSATLPLLLLSGVLLPMSLAPGWLQAVADVNPLAYAVSAERALFANRLDDLAVLQGFLVVGALGVLGVLSAARSFGRSVA